MMSAYLADKDRALSAVTVEGSGPLTCGPGLTGPMCQRATALYSYCRGTTSGSQCEAALQML
jgi:hypothetical protein